MTQRFVGGGKKIAEPEQFGQACSKTAEINLTHRVTSQKLAQNCKKNID